jgi:hypothetical protein
MDSTAIPIQVQTLGPLCLPKREPLESVSGTKQTCSMRRRMSVIGAKRTWRALVTMSANDPMRTSLQGILPLDLGGNPYPPVQGGKSFDMSNVIEQFLSKGHE